MNDPYFDLLMWARGPGFTIALVVLAGGIILRLTEILFLGRKTDLAPAKGNAVVAGLKTIFTRSVPREGLVKFSPVTYIGGYVFHIAFFIAFLLFGPHIALIKSVIGLSWPDAGRVIIESAAVIALVAMLALLYSRITDPVRRSISGFQDYLVWVLTVLPLITGYIAVNKLIGDGTLMMALHILSAEMLMIAFPFTKLMHAVTFITSRYYNGAIQGRKGAES